MGLISGNFEAILFEPKESWPTKLKSPLPCRRVYGGGGEGEIIKCLYLCLLWTCLSF